MIRSVGGGLKESMANLVTNSSFLDRFTHRPYPRFGSSATDWVLHVPTDRDEKQTELSEVEMVKDGRFQRVLRIDTEPYKKEWVRLLHQVDPHALSAGKMFDIRFDIMCPDHPNPVQWVGLVRTSPVKKYDSVFRVRFPDKTCSRWKTFHRQRVMDDYADGETYYIAISIEPGVRELYLANFSFGEAPAATDAVVPAPLHPVMARANGQYQSILPQFAAAPVAGRKSLGVLSWSVSHNPLGRAFLLADMLRDTYNVELAGPLFPSWGKHVWEPVAESLACPLHYFQADNFAQFVLRSITFVKAHPYDVVIACKARFPSLFMALLYKLLHNSTVVVDVDDLELAFFDVDSGLSHDELLAALKDKDWGQPYVDLWTRYADTMLELADGVTVSSPQLQKRFGGRLIAHARDEHVFDPALYDRDVTRAELGFKPSDKVVLFFGTPRPHKGLNEIAAALDDLNDPNVVFCIMGRIRQPEIREELLQFAKVRMALFGDQPFSRAAELVNIADVICVWQEHSLITDHQFPAKLTDAMAMGRSILVRAVPPLADLLAEGAVIDVEKEGLEVALTRVLRDTGLRATQGQVARAAYVREFSYDVVRPQLLAAITDAMVHRRPVPAAYERLIEAIQRDLAIYPEDYARMMAVFHPAAAPDVEAETEPLPDGNLVRNPQFRRWQNDVHQTITTRYQETAADWLVDFRAGTKPAMAVSLTEVANIGGFERTYGLRIHLAEAPAGGYARLIAVLDGDTPRPGTYHFSVGLRTPLDASLGTLGIREVFLANLKGGNGQNSVERLATVRKNVAVQRSVRVQDVPVTITADMLAKLGPNDRLALAFDFGGAGDLVIYEPELVGARRPAAAPAAREGLFEDQHIRSQIDMLKLSPLWRNGEAMSRFGERPRPRVAPQRPAQTPFVQIVIPVYNAAQDVEDCVRSILRNTTSPFEIILSDDGSEPYTADRLREMAQSDPRVRCHTNPHNLGYTRNINQALQQTVADYVVLLNSDVIVSKGWIDKLYTALSTSPDTAAAGPLSNAASWQSVPSTKSGSDWAVNALFSGMNVDDMAALIDDLSDAEYPVFPLLNGFCTLFRRAVLEEAGYFADDAFPMGYGEENDLCLRVNRLGYCLRVADNAYVYHKKSRSFGAERRRELSKKANVLLRKRHPEINFPALESLMRECSPLNVLRQRLMSAMQIEIEAQEEDLPPQTLVDEIDVPPAVWRA